MFWLLMAVGLWCLGSFVLALLVGACIHDGDFND
jgi:hypothetical protein